MQFPQSFLPTAREVGVLPMATELFILVALFSFVAGFVFFVVRGNSIHPSHRVGGTLMAVVCLVAAAGYWFMHLYYHDMLYAVVLRQDPVDRRVIFHTAFFAISQYRYADWAVTTPLLLLKMVLILKVRPREILGWIALLLGAGFWMIVAGSIGDQQFKVGDGSMLVGRHLFWGTLSALGYLVIPYVLLRKLGPKYGGQSDDESGHAFRLMAYSTVTVWAVYPLGYLAPVVFPSLDMNWVQLAYVVADVVSKLGVGVVAFMAGAEELARRVPPEAVQAGRITM